MAVSWTVTGQLDNQYGDVGSGTPVLGHVISFITGDGDRGSVFIPADKYSVANVRAAIAAKATLIDQVSKLHAPA